MAISIDSITMLFDYKVIELRNEDNPDFLISLSKYFEMVFELYPENREIINRAVLDSLKVFFDNNPDEMKKQDNVLNHINPGLLHSIGIYVRSLDDEAQMYLSLYQTIFAELHRKIPEWNERIRRALQNDIQELITGQINIEIKPGVILENAFSAEFTTRNDQIDITEQIPRRNINGVINNITLIALIFMAPLLHALTSHEFYPIYAIFLWMFSVAKVIAMSRESKNYSTVVIRNGPVIRIIPKAVCYVRYQHTVYKCYDEQTNITLDELLTALISRSYNMK